MYAVNCIASGLPIEAGDRVMAMLVTESDIGDAWPCSPHAMWSPRTPPIVAEYNGYGTLDEIEVTPIVDLWTRLLDRDAFSTGSLHAYLTAIQERSLQVPDQLDGDEHDVGLALIRFDVWAQLLAMPPLRYRSFGDADAFIAAEQTLRRTAALAKATGSPVWVSLLNEQYIGHALGAGEPMHGCLVADCNVCSVPGHVSWSDHYRQWLESGKTDDSVGQRFAEAVYVYYQFRRLGIAFAPSYMVPEQDPDWKARVMWAEMVKASAEMSDAEDEVGRA